MAEVQSPVDGIPYAPTSRDVADAQLWKLVDWYNLEGLNQVRPHELIDAIESALLAAGIERPAGV